MAIIQLYFISHGFVEVKLQTIQLEVILHGFQEVTLEHRVILHGQT